MSFKSVKTYENKKNHNVGQDKVEVELKNGWISVGKCGEWQMGLKFNKPFNRKITDLKEYVFDCMVTRHVVQFTIYVFDCMVERHVVHINAHFKLFQLNYDMEVAKVVSSMNEQAFDLLKKLIDKITESVNRNEIKGKLDKTDECM